MRDKWLTIVLVVLLAYYLLLALVFAGMGGENQMPYVGLATVGGVCIVWSLFVKTRLAFLLLRFAGIVLVSTLVYFDMKDRIHVETLGDALAEMTYFPVLCLVAYSVHSVFRSRQFQH